MTRLRIRVNGKAAFSSEMHEAIISPVGVRMVRGFQSWLPGIPARAEKGRIPGGRLMVLLYIHREW